MKIELRRMIVPYWKHMRLPFQLTLAPLFLWGLFIGEARVGVAAVLGFVSLHILLYPGITAFNSAFDRDTGPVSGMEQPPEVPPRLLAFSIILQLLGAAIAAAVGADFVIIYCAIALLAAAYSHPLTRWKASPWGSAMTVALGQGLLGFAAGWSAGEGASANITSEGFAAGAVAAAFTTLGLYPSTQVFQVEEDRNRRDRTLAVALGPAGALRTGSLCLLAAGAAASWLMGVRFGSVDATFMLAAYAMVIGHNELFARRIAAGKLDLYATYQWAMRTSIVSTVGFLCFILFQPLRRG